MHTHRVLFTAGDRVAARKVSVSDAPWERAAGGLPAAPATAPWLLTRSGRGRVPCPSPSLGSEPSQGSSCGFPWGS